jgi:hypothetical protein
MERTEITLKGGLINTAPYHKLVGPDGFIPYLESKLTGEPQIVELGTAPASTMEVYVKKAIVKAQSYQVSAEIPMSTSRDLDKLHGVSATDKMEATMYNEAVATVEKQIAKEYWENAWTNYENEKSGWQSFVLSFFGLEKYTYVDNNPNALASRIRALSNKIATETRRGPGNFVILSSQLLMLLEDCPAFHFDTGQPSLTKEHSHSYLRAGYLGNIIVYHNTTDQWNSMEILVGRMGANDEPGIHFCEYSNEYQTMVDPLTMSTKMRLLSRYDVVRVGDCDGFYIADLISLEKKPWWRKLFRL